MCVKSVKMCRLIKGDKFSVPNSGLRYVYVGRIKENENRCIVKPINRLEQGIDGKLPTLHSQKLVFIQR